MRSNQDLTTCGNNQALTARIAILRKDRICRHLYRKILPNFPGGWWNAGG